VYAYNNLIFAGAGRAMEHLSLFLQGMAYDGEMARQLLFHG
jgi:hypothetical protein